MNQAKTRLQSLGLLDRTVGNVPDDTLVAAVEALTEEHREVFDGLVGAASGDTPDPDAIRGAAQAGRLDGTLESIALLLTDKALADCIEQLGEHSEHPSSDELRDVLPGLVERHGLPIVQLMLASTVAGEAPAAPIIRDLLKHDELVKLPPAEAKPLPKPIDTDTRSEAERAELKAKRAEAKQAKQAAARARREQQARARNRA